MDLYFSPMACSMATRIALYESGDAANFLEVDPKTKRLLGDGADYLAIYPLGMVPSLRTDDGQLLTENAAILQYVADRRPNRASRRSTPSSARGCISGCVSSARSCTRGCSSLCSARKPPPR